MAQVRIAQQQAAEAASGATESWLGAHSDHASSSRPTRACAAASMGSALAHCALPLAPVPTCAPVSS